MKVGDCMLRGIILVGALLAIGGAPAMAASGGGPGIYSPHNPPVPITPHAARNYYSNYGATLSGRQISHGTFGGGLKATADAGPSDRAGGGSSHSGAWEAAFIALVSLLAVAGASVLGRRTVLSRRARAS